MKLGIPTLCRYDLLAALLLSAERGSVKPTGYIIIDNGGDFTRGMIRNVMGDRSDVVELISPGKNIGVAASWNRIIDLTLNEHGVIISNDDIEFGEKTFEELVTVLQASGSCDERGAHFVEGDGWALFGQTSHLSKSVGAYDENFWPAYYEDVDYDERMRRAGFVATRPLTEPVKHRGWATTTALGNPEWLAQGRARNHDYFLRKWGGESRNPRWNGNADSPQWDEPFNGAPPPGWALRGTPPKPIRTMHWEVLNHIAALMGAESYLEIGVCTGENMRRMTQPGMEKWGVDPFPQVAAVAACDVFVPKTSAAFFDDWSPHTKFDLIFIDGDHHAEVVYDEVMRAIPCLTATGLIVLHDCNPHTEEMQRVTGAPLPSEWTGDVWKAVVRLRMEGYIFRTISSDYGIGILLPSLYPYGVPRIRERPEACQLTYQDLEKDRANLLGLIEPWEWPDWLEVALTARGLYLCGPTSMVDPEHEAAGKILLALSHSYVAGTTTPDSAAP